MAQIAGTFLSPAALQSFPPSTSLLCIFMKSESKLIKYRSSLGETLAFANHLLGDLGEPSWNYGRKKKRPKHGEVRRLQRLQIASQGMNLSLLSTLTGKS